MEMHPLASAPHSFKELMIHIGIVTVGILIALSLEGIRETIHDHYLVRDTRESFRIEMQADLRQMNAELAGIDKANHATHAVIVDLPALQKNPAELKQRVDALSTNGYSVGSSSWAGALSSGALAHMSAQEVSRYSDFDLGVREYASLEDRALTQQDDLHAFVDSRHEFGPTEIEGVEERLRKFQSLTQTMRYVGAQVVDGLKQALPRQ